MRFMHDVRNGGRGCCGGIGFEIRVTETWHRGLVLRSPAGLQGPSPFLKRLRDPTSGYIHFSKRDWRESRILLWVFSVQYIRRSWTETFHSRGHIYGPCTVHLFISHVTAANGQKARPCSTERSPPRQNCGLRKLGNKIGTNRDGGREWRNLNAACGEEKSKEGERIADLAACGDEGSMKLSWVPRRQVDQRFIRPCERASALKKRTGDLL